MPTFTDYYWFTLMLLATGVAFFLFDRTWVAVSRHRAARRRANLAATHPLRLGEAVPTSALPPLLANLRPQDLTVELLAGDGKCFLSLSGRADRRRVDCLVNAETKRIAYGDHLLTVLASWCASGVRVRILLTEAPHPVVRRILRTFQRQMGGVGLEVLHPSRPRLADGTDWLDDVPAWMDDARRAPRPVIVRLPDGKALWTGLVIGHWANTFLRNDDYASPRALAGDPRRQALLARFANDLQALAARCAPLPQGPACAASA